MTQALKVRLRAEALARRAAIDPDARRAAAAALASLGLKLALAARAIVAGFVAVRDEIDPLPLMQALAAGGAQLALPAVIGARSPLAFRAWSPGGALAPGAYGIPEPPPQAAAVTPDVVLVPLAAFDRAGHRIGYGGGYYDRTLAALRATRAVLAIGVAFAVQETAEIPAQPHDAALDLVLTEAGIIDCRR